MSDLHTKQGRCESCVPSDSVRVLLNVASFGWIVFGIVLRTRTDVGMSVMKYLGVSIVCSFCSSFCLLALCRSLFVDV
jgi:hypothetical protein